MTKELEELLNEIVAFLKNKESRMPMPYPATRKELIEKIEKAKGEKA